MTPPVMEALEVPPDACPNKAYAFPVAVSHVLLEAVNDVK
jgi:hypothetical protein